MSMWEEVRYSIRFEDRTSAETVIKYMSDDMLLREIQVDDKLSSYSIIMLDEAASRMHHPHRPLFGIPKKLFTHRRPDLKLIVTSATLNAEKSADYFFGCSILSIPGRVHHVEILYSREPVTEYFGKLRCAQCVWQGKEH